MTFLLSAEFQFLPAVLFLLSFPFLADFVGHARMSEQTVGMPVSQVEPAVSSGEAGSSWTRTHGTTSAAATAVEKSVGEAWPPGFAEYSPTTGSESQSFLEKVKMDLLGPVQNARPVPPMQQLQSLLVEVGFLLS